MKSKHEYLTMQADTTYCVRLSKLLSHDYSSLCSKLNINQSQQSKKLIIDFLTNRESTENITQITNPYYRIKNNKGVQLSIYLPTELLNDFKIKCQSLNIKPSNAMRALLIIYIDKNTSNNTSKTISEQDKKKLYYLSQSANYATSFRISRELYDNFQEMCKKQSLDYAKTVRQLMINWLVSQNLEKEDL